MKKCSKCNENKDLCEFPIRKDSPDGHRNECRDCKSKYLKEYHKNPPIKEVYPEGYKRCSGCQKLLTLNNFHKHKPRCKDCRNIENTEYRKNNPEYCKKWLESHREERKVYASEYRKNNKDKIAVQKKEYYANNPDKKEERKRSKKQWYEANKERLLIEHRQYKKDNKKRIKNQNAKYYKDNSDKIKKRQLDYIKNNPEARLRHRLRSRLWRALQGRYKSGSAVKDLSCSIEYLKQYLESKFQSGMNWENYGEWHIDHIIPLFNFDLTDREQVKKACHYTNLQPLWAEDNLKKGAKMPFKEK